MNIRKNTALITGASRGLGRALTLELFKMGYDLALVGRSQISLENLKSKLDKMKQADQSIVIIDADVGKKEDIYPIIGQATQAIGPISLLINNASTLGNIPLRILLEGDCETFENVLQVNVLGPFRLMKAIVPSMILHGHGTVLNISSDAGLNSYPTWGFYGASKAALHHLSHTLASEIEGTGVNIHSIDPGEMDTQMHHDAIPDADPKTLSDPKDVARNLLKLTFAS